MILTADQLLARHPGIVAEVKERSERHAKAEQAEAEREAWLERRRGRMTASAFGAMFTKGLKPTQSDTAQTYLRGRVAERLGVRQKSWSTAATRWGNDTEPAALEAFATKLGVTIEQPGFMLFGDYAGATPDGVFQHNDRTEIVQIKCPYNPANHVMNMTMRSAEDLKSQPIYYVQVQFELLVTGASFAYFASFDPRYPDEKARYRLHYIEVPIDTVLRAQIIDQIEWGTSAIAETLQLIQR